MKKDKSLQKAGDNSIQFQAETIQVGIDEKRVREMIKEENKIVLQEMSIIARDTAIERLDNYTDVYIPKLVRANLLASFADPAIQMLFKKSERTAICTEREKDYELLSELLIHRVNKKGNYTISAAIEKAINEVNNISDNALLCLTIVYAIISYTPKSGDIKEGLSVLDNLYGKIINNNTLPNDKDWIDNLEIVGAIKINNFSSFKKLEDIYFDNFKGYSNLGIKKDSENHKKAIKLLTDNNIPTEILVDNILNNEYVRLNIFSADSINNIKIIEKCNNTEITRSLTDLQKEALKEIINLYDKNDTNKTNFTNLLHSYKNFDLLLKWWNNTLTQPNFSITTIGKVIAHTNAKSIDYTLPDLN